MSAVETTSRQARIDTFVGLDALGDVLRKSMEEIPELREGVDALGISWNDLVVGHCGEEETNDLQLLGDLWPEEDPDGNPEFVEAEKRAAMVTARLFIELARHSDDLLRFAAEHSAYAERLGRNHGDA